MPISTSTQASCDKVKVERFKARGGWRTCFVALLFTFYLSSVTLNAQCVDVKIEDNQAFVEAVALIDSRQYKEAGQKMRRVASKNPKAADPQYWLGIIAAKEGNNTAIRRYFSKCLELCPEYPGALAHYYMGVVYYTDGDYSSAKASLDKYFDCANGSDERAVMAVYEEAANYLRWSTFLADATLNAAPYDPHRVAGVSSKYDEMLPFLTLDGREMYYLRQVPDKQKTTVYHSEFQLSHWQLYCSRRTGDTTFTKGEPLPAPFNSGDAEGGLSITADGTELYYSIIRGGNSDIYMVRRVDGQWQQPEALGPQVNSPDAWDSQPSVSPDGSQLFFASNRSGGLGGIDIWRCHRLANGDWSRAENLGKAVNTLGNEKCPFVAADNYTFYFLSDGWQGFGGYDIFFTYLDHPAYDCPLNIGLPINTEGDELSFGVTPDGRYAYTTGRLPDSRSMDIIMFDLYPNARPAEATRLCRMQVTDTLGNPLPATVKVSSSDTYHAAGDSVTVMLYEEDKNVLTASVPGYIPRIFRVRSSDVDNGRMKEVVSLQPIAEGAVETMDLSDYGVLVALAKWLIENPRVRIAIECPKKADAEAAARALRGEGLRPDRITFRGGTDIKHKQIRIL